MVVILVSIGRSGRDPLFKDFNAWHTALVLTAIAKISHVCNK